MTWDILNPPRVEIKNAVRVSPMGKPQDSVEKDLEEATLQKFLKQKNREQARIDRRMEAIQKLKLNKLRENVKKAKAKWEKAVKEYEDALA